MLRNILSILLISSLSLSVMADAGNNIKITNGDDVPLGKYPWFGTISLEQQAETYVACGAALIASDWVVTAAHCVTSYYPELGYNAKIVFGLYDLNKPYKIEKRLAKKIISFWGNNQKDLTKDIALIQLDKKVTSIKPVKISTDAEKPKSGSTITVMGFGLHNDKNGKITYPNRMQKATIPVQSASICNDPKYHIENFNKKTDICAGTITGKRVNAALGDSGSPAVQLINNKYKLVGIVSHGANYTNGWVNPLPAVYTFTGAFNSWINSQIKNNQ